MCMRQYVRNPLHCRQPAHRNLFQLSSVLYREAKTSRFCRTYRALSKEIREKRGSAGFYRSITKICQFRKRNVSEECIPLFYSAGFFEAHEWEKALSRTQGGNHGTPHLYFWGFPAHTIFTACILPSGLRSEMRNIPVERKNSSACAEDRHYTPMPFIFGRERSTR